MNLSIRAVKQMGYCILMVVFMAGTAPLTAQTSTESPDFSHVVRFEIGQTYFSEGDFIKVEEVRGPTDTIVPGNTYLVRGSYTLASQSGALLSSNVTADAHNVRLTHFAANLPTSTKVRQGEGHFSVYLKMDTNGFPHISFYPDDGGASFAGVYFGTGGSLMQTHADAAYRPRDTVSFH